MRDRLVHADWIVVGLYLILIAMGWLTLCGASHNIGEFNFLSWDTRTGKQLAWIGCSLLLGIIILKSDDRYLDTFSGAFYWLMMLLLIITPFIAKDIKGSKSWISLGFMNIQPAEFAKCATALFLARTLQQKNIYLDTFSKLSKVVWLVLLPMGLIILQKETGSALVYASFFIVFYREGMSGSILFCAIAAILYFVIGIKYSSIPISGTVTPVGEFVVLCLVGIFALALSQVYHATKVKIGHISIGASVLIAISYIISLYIKPFDISWVILGALLFLVCHLLWIAINERDKVNHYLLIAIFTIGSVGFLYSADYTLNHILQPHQQGRIKVLLGMDEDLRGAGYNVNQAKIAIGSGGVFGKGFLNGTQTKLDYVPEQDTDFIFCTVGEEEGFVGSSVVLITFLALALRLIYLSERQKNIFGRVYGYSVVSILLFHLFINIGMVIGLTPVIGIPLPFFSYGGSSLWGFTLLLFLFLRIDKTSRTRLY